MSSITTQNKLPLPLTNDGRRELPQEESQKRENFSSFSLDGLEEDKIFSHLFLTDQVRGTALEGSYRSYWKKLLDNALPILKQKGILTKKEHQQLNEELQSYFTYVRKIENFLIDNKNDKSDCDFIQSLAREIREKIEKLEIGGSLLLPGGYSGKPGHAMAYKIIRNHRDYTIIVINTGDHGGFHLEQVEERKVKIAPFLVFSGISLAEIFPGNSNLFLESLLSPQVHREKGTFSARQLYQASFKALLQDLTFDQPLCKVFITPQRSGNCSWKVLLAILRMNLPPEKYKKVHYYLRLTTLHSLFDQDKTKRGWSREKVAMYEDSLEKLCYEANKKLREKLIDEKDVAPLLELEQDLSRLLEEKKKKLGELEEKSQLEESLKNPQSLSKTNISLISFVNHRVSRAQKNWAIRWKSPSFFMENPNPELLDKQLATLFRQLQGHIFESRMPFYQNLVDNFVRKIPLDADFWDKIKEKQRSLVLKHATNLLHNYHRITIARDRSSSPARMMTALTLFILIFEMGKKEESKLFSAENSHIIPFSIFPFIIKNPFLLPCSEQERKRYKELIDYYSKQKGVEFIPFQFSRIEEANGKKRVQSGEEIFFRNIINHFESLESSLARKYDEVGLTKKENFSKEDVEVALLVSNYKFFEPNRGGNEYRNAYSIIQANHLAYSFLKSYRAVDKYTKNSSFPYKLRSSPCYYMNGLQFGHLPAFDKPWGEIADSLFRRSYSALPSDNEFLMLNSHFCWADPNFYPYRTSNDQRQTETYPLKSYPARKSNSFAYLLSLLSSASAEREVQMEELLSHFEEYISHFSDAALQTQFWVQFFKIPIQDSNSIQLEAKEDNTLPQYAMTQDFISQIEKNPSLIPTFLTFLKKGFAYFTEGETPDLPSSCFFVRLAIHAIEIITTSDSSIEVKPLLLFLKDIQESHFRRIQSGVDRGSYSDEEKALFYLHRLYYHLVASPIREQKVAPKEILADYMAVNLLTFPKEHRMDFLQDSIEPLMHDYLSKLPTLQEELPWEEILPAIFQRSGISFAAHGLKIENSKGEEKNLIVRATNEIGDLYAVHLTERLIHVNDEILSIAKSFEYTDETFLFLFGPTFRPAVQSSANWYHFSHPDFGEIRVRNKELSDGIQVMIDGRWHNFIPPKTVEGYKYILPMAFVNYDHLFWYPVGEREQRADQIIITHRKNPRKILYTIDSAGMIRKGNLRYFADKEENALSLFDIPSQRLIVTDDKNEPIRIFFPRVFSLEGQPLVFIRGKSGENQKTNEWFWEGEDYKLRSSKSVGYLGGDFEQYVEVEHPLTRQRKVLIPLFSLNESFHPFTSQRKLLAKESEKDIFSSEAEEKKQYISFPVKGGKVVADSLLGQIFLTYLYMGTRQFKAAFKQLDFVTEAENYTEKELEWLEKVVCYPKDFNNFIPDNLAISLKAALIYISLQDKTNIEWEREGFYEKLISIYLHYQDRLTTITPSFLLQKEEELFLIEKLLPFFTGDDRTKTEQLIKSKLVIRKQFLTEDKEPSREILTKHFLQLPKWPLPSSEWLEVNCNPDNITCRDNRIIDLSSPSRLIESWEKNEYIAKRNRLLLFHHGLNVMLKGNHEEMERLRFIVNFQLASSRFKKFSRIDFPLYPLLFLLNDDNRVDRIRSFQNNSEQQNSRFTYQRKVKSFYQLISHDPKNYDYTHLGKEAFERANLKGRKIEPSIAPPEEQKDPPAYKVDLTPLNKLSEWFNSKDFEEKEISYSIQDSQIRDLERRTESFNEQFVAKTFDTAVQRELNDLIEEIREGEKRLPKKRVRVSKEIALSMFKDLQSHIEDNEKAKKDLAESILRTVNNPSEDIKRSLATKSGRVPPLTMEKLEMLFLQKDLLACRKAFPAKLTDQEIQKILDEVANWEVMEIAHLRMKEIEKLLAELSNEMDEDRRDILSDKLRSSASQDFSHLTTNRHNHVLLVFARRSEKIPRKDQIENLAKVSPDAESCIFHAIMGSGKTSVIAALWAYLQAIAGNLPVFISDKSLIKVVINALKQSQVTSFGQRVFCLDYTREDLHPKKGGNMRLKWILQRLEKGLKNRELLVVQPSFLQMLSLETRIASRDLVDIPSRENQERLKLLLDTLSFIKKHCVGKGDEIDRLLDTKLEVNFPIGEAQQIPHRRIEFVRNLFFLLANSFEEEIGLTSGKQSLVSPAKWQELKPRIANKMFDIPAIQMHDSYKESFVRFMDGSFDATKNSDDKKFIDEVRRFARSEDESDQEKAELIALGKHLLEDLLPKTFTKSMNRHYGRSRTDSPGKIIPYIATDTPATTQFGNPLEALVLHYQAALSKGVTKDQVQKLVEQLIASAKKRTAHKYKTIADTPEGKFLVKISGNDLITLQTPMGILKATDHINQSVFFRLLIESETAAQEATYFSNFASSSGQDLCASFTTIYGMTGTPWNESSFPNKLSGENVHWDKGSRGKIVHTMLSRAKETLVHSGNPDNIMETLLSMFEKKQKPFNALLDSGALFKNFSNEEVATYFLKVADKKGFQKKHVIFFHKKEGETECNRLAVLTKKGEEHVVSFLPGSTKADIEGKGIKLEETLFYLDDIHTTGVDLPFPEKTRAIVTIDENISLRTLLQTIMREREYLTSQRASFLLSNDLKEKIPSGEDPILFILQLAAANQAVQKSESLLRAFKQKFEEVIKTQFLNSLSNEALRKEKILKLRIQVYKEFLFPQLSIDLADIFLGKDETVSAIDKLSFIKNRLEKRFKDNIQKVEKDELYAETELESDLAAFSEKFGRILQEAETKKDLFPTEVSKKSSAKSGGLDESSFGMELENEQEAELEQEEEQEVRLENELQRELEHYLKKYHYDDRKESIWTDSEITNFLQDISQRNAQVIHQKNIVNLPELFREGSANIIDSYRRKYRKFADIFSDTIYATKNFRYVKKEMLTVFFKGQRLANQILVVERDENDYFFLLLSEKEAASFQKVLSTAYKKGDFQNVWLISSNARTFADNPSILPLENRKIRKALAEINLFSGSISAINSLDLTEARHWMRDEDPQRKAIKKKYVKMRVEHKPTEKAPLKVSRLLSSKDQDGVTQYFALCYEREMLAKTMNPERIKEIEAYRSKEEIDTLHDIEIAYIHPDAVCFLSEEQIPYLSKKEQIEKVADEKIKFITAKQAKHLSKSQALQVTKIDVIRSLPPSTLDEIVRDTDRNRDAMLHLSSSLLRSQIEKLTDSRWIKYLSLDQLIQLSQELQREVPESRIRGLPKTELTKLPDLLLMKMSEQQWKDLPPERVSEITHPELLQSLKSPYLEKISSPDKICQLRDNQIEMLNEAQLKELSTTQVQAIEKEELIQRLPKSAVQKLHLDQYKKLSDKQLKDLSEEQVLEIKDRDLLHRLPSLDKLSEEQVQLLTDPEALKKLSSHQIPFVDEEYLRHLTEEQLSHLSQQQIESIHLPINKTILNLKPEQITRLSNKQINAAKVEIIKQIALSVIPSILKKLSPEQKNSLTVEQIQSLSKDDIQWLTRVNIKHLACRQLVHLSPNQLADASFMQRIVRLFLLCLLPIFQTIGTVFSCCHSYRDKEEAVEVG